jgi:hypothetical protein
LQPKHAPAKHNRNQNGVAKMAGETSNISDATLAKRHKQPAIIGRLTVASLQARGTCRFPVRSFALI